jgi:hypothetical protein
MEVVPLAPGASSVCLPSELQNPKAGAKECKAPDVVVNT